jgi:hypothetical protein
MPKGQPETMWRRRTTVGMRAKPPRHLIRGNLRASTSYFSKRAPLTGTNPLVGNTSESLQERRVGEAPKLWGLPRRCGCCPIHSYRRREV